MAKWLRAFLVLTALAAGGSASAGVYTVRRGDTLSTIAARNQTTVAALVAANGIGNTNLIRVGDMLRLSPSGPSPGPGHPVTYVVRAGDTLSGIAAKNHTTVAALVAANTLKDASVIRPGATLTLHPAAFAPAAKPMQLITAVRPVANPGSYVVRPNDTVASVAAAFGLSPVALAAANGITDDRLYVGARITTAVSAAGQPPQPAYPFVAQPTDLVASGDTLAKVARKAHVTTAALAAANGLPSGARPSVGTRLLIPGSWTCPVKGATFMNDWGFPRPGPSWHQGLDLMAPRGTPVVAPVAGTLQRLPNPKGGNAFNLYGDDGNRYYGAHLDRYGAQGRVKSGTVIGYVGDSGDAEGGAPHLHFEIHPANGAAVPPYPTAVAACR